MKIRIGASEKVKTDTGVAASRAMATLAGLLRPSSSSWRLLLAMVGVGEQEAGGDQEAECGDGAQEAHSPSRSRKAVVSVPCTNFAPAGFELPASSPSLGPGRFALDPTRQRR